MKQNKIYIIAEIGVNHNGSLQHARFNPSMQNIRS